MQIKLLYFSKFIIQNYYFILNYLLFILYPYIKVIIIILKLVKVHLLLKAFLIFYHTLIKLANNISLICKYL